MPIVWLRTPGHRSGAHGRMRQARAGSLRSQGIRGQGVRRDPASDPRWSPMGPQRPPSTSETPDNDPGPMGGCRERGLDPCFRREFGGQGARRDPASDPRCSPMGPPRSPSTSETPDTDPGPMGGCRKRGLDPCVRREFGGRARGVIPQATRGAPLWGHHAHRLAPKPRTPIRGPWADAASARWIPAFAGNSGGRARGVIPRATRDAPLCGHHAHRPPPKPRTPIRGPWADAASVGWIPAFAGNSGAGREA